MKTWISTVTEALGTLLALVGLVVVFNLVWMAFRGGWTRLKNWWTWKARHGAALESLHNRVGAEEASRKQAFFELAKQLCDANKRLNALERGGVPMRDNPVCSLNPISSFGHLGEIVEDLRARVPVGRLVSEDRLQTVCGQLAKRLSVIEMRRHKADYPGMAALGDSPIDHTATSRLDHFAKELTETNRTVATMVDAINASVQQCQKDTRELNKHTNACVESLSTRIRKQEQVTGVATMADVTEICGRVAGLENQIRRIDRDALKDAAASKAVTAELSKQLADVQMALQQRERGKTTQFAFYDPLADCFATMSDVKMLLERIKSLEEYRRAVENLKADEENQRIQRGHAYDPQCQSHVYVVGADFAQAGTSSASAEPAPSSWMGTTAGGTPKQVAAYNQLVVDTVNKLTERVELMNKAFRAARDSAFRRLTAHDQRLATLEAHPTILTPKQYVSEVRFGQLFDFFQRFKKQALKEEAPLPPPYTVLSEAQRNAVLDPPYKIKPFTTPYPGLAEWVYATLDKEQAARDEAVRAKAAQDKRLYDTLHWGTFKPNA